MKQSIAELLKAEGFVQDAQVEGDGVDRVVVVTFRQDRGPLSLARVSRPGSRIYVGVDEMRPYLHGAPLAIVSTSQGLLPHKEAQKKNLGGELLCTIA